ncbi:MAG: hypothetical protein A4E63_01854 [Syntrophorhabdus sp. PtaU1.Bin050]|nr:MAG: hypothetical protein A4E63_01854 [Syntrophorhabdus sp. PtaU1.Bin050]
MLDKIAGYYNRRRKGGLTMIHLYKKLIFFVLIVGILSGCALGSEYSIFGGKRVNSAGANQLLPEAFEEVNIVKLLDPENKAKYNVCDKESTVSDKEACKIDVAFNAFYETCPSKDQNNKCAEDELILRRNRIQETLIAASVQRCNVYLSYIRRIDSKVGLALGSLATILGGAGAIVTGTDSARALAGSAGISSGLRAEFKEDFFYNQTINVISKGIRERRKEIYKEIEAHRGEDGGACLTQYPVEAAVKDALLYHGACSMIAGLETASAVLDNKASGLAAMEEAIKMIKKAQDEANSLKPSP